MEETAYNHSMKNTVVINQTEAAQCYFDCVREHLEISRQDLHFKEFSDELLALATEVSQLMSSDLRVARKQFAELFRVGSTMMLVPDGFETLEKWSDNDEPFQIAIFTDDGEPIGAFSAADVSW